MIENIIFIELFVNIIYYYFYFSNEVNVKTKSLLKSCDGNENWFSKTIAALLQYLLSSFLFFLNITDR